MMNLEWRIIILALMKIKNVLNGEIIITNKIIYK